jgi:hypothetical protein
MDNDGYWREAEGGSLSHASCVCKLDGGRFRINLAQKICRKWGGGEDHKSRSPINIRHCVMTENILVFWASSLSAMQEI